MGSASTPRQHIVASDLPALLHSIAGALSVAREEVDNLNVFPVPDGDTGTNLHATVQSALLAVEALEAPHTSDADLATAAARGALRGAAGNSGVIFSQVVRAVAEHLAERAITSARLGGVLDRARTLSYDAIAQPVDGTILTAMDAAADAAADGDDPDLVTALRRVVEAVGPAVAATRDMLEANRRAGVVDAGARGFEVALDGVLAFLEGRSFEAVAPPPVRRTASEVVTRESGSLDYAYEVQYLLEAPDEAAEPLRAALDGLGDSVVVVACGGLLNVHVHTNDVDDAIEAGAAHGEPSRVIVTCFEDQIGSRHAIPGGSDGPSPADDSARSRADRPAVGYLAVVPGAGLVQLVGGMGAVAVDGAAGALPTVATVLNAVGTVDADEVVLLPGHPNVVPTMHQASDVSVAEGGRALFVVDEAASVPTVLAVLAVAPIDELDLDTLAATARHVAGGEVVAAVRDADTPLGPVREGQWLGLADGDVVAVTDDVVAAVVAVAGSTACEDTEIVTLIAGGEVDDGERSRVTDGVADCLPGVEIEVVDGGQRPARWIVGAE